MSEEYDTIGDFLESECKRDVTDDVSFYVCKIEDDGGVVVPISDELKSLEYSEVRKDTILEKASEGIKLTD